MPGRLVIDGKASGEGREEALQLQEEGVHMPFAAGMRPDKLRRKVDKVRKDSLG